MIPLFLKSQKFPEWSSLQDKIHWASRHEFQNQTSVSFLDSQYLSQVAKDQLQSDAPHQTDPCELESDGLHGMGLLLLFIFFLHCVLLRSLRFPTSWRFKQAMIANLMLDAATRIAMQTGPPQTPSYMDCMAEKDKFNDNTSTWIRGPGSFFLLNTARNFEFAVPGMTIVRGYFPLNPHSLPALFTKTIRSTYSQRTKSFIVLSQRILDSVISNSLVRRNKEI